MSNPQTDGHICGPQEYSNTLNLCPPTSMKDNLLVI